MQTALSSGSTADQASIQMNRAEKIHLADIDSVVRDDGPLKCFVSGLGYVLTFKKIRPCVAAAVDAALELVGETAARMDDQALNLPTSLLSIPRGKKIEDAAPNKNFSRGLVLRGQALIPRARR